MQIVIPLRRVVRAALRLLESIAGLAVIVVQLQQVVVLIVLRLQRRAMAGLERRLISLVVQDILVGVEGVSVLVVLLLNLIAEVVMFRRDQLALVVSG